jgi:hypothetical protein
MMHILSLTGAMMLMVPVAFANAQTPLDMLPRGARIRVVAPVVGVVWAAEAVLDSLSADSLYVRHVSDPPPLRQASRVAIPRSGIQRLEVPRLNSPSRIDRAVKGAAWGLGIYAMVAAVGIVHESATCKGPDCFGEGMAWIGLVAGIPWAAGAGAGIGFLLPVRRWQRVPVQ